MTQKLINDIEELINVVSETGNLIQNFDPGKQSTINKNM